MPAKLSLAAFDRTTSVGILALQHLINKLEGLPQLRAVDQHEAGILASRLSEEYQDLLGKVDPYLSAESLPQGLDEDHIFAVVAQIKDIFVRGSILASKLTKPEIPVGSGRFSSASGGHPGVLVHELPKLSLPCFDGQAKCWSEFWSKFTTLVDESPALTPKQKLLSLIHI